MARTLRLALAIVEATSIPLIVLLSLYILSGYQMLNPGLYIMPAARTVHTDRILRVVFLALVYLHSLTGLIIMCERRIRRRLLRSAVEYIAIAALSIFIAVSLAIELTLR